MVWNIFLTYIVVSEILFFAWIFYSVKFCGGCGITFDRGATSSQKASFVGLVGLLMLITAPFGLPILLVSVTRNYLAARRGFQKLSRLYKEIFLEPLHEANIPVELKDYLDEQTPAAIAMEFENLGDYWLKDEPVNSKARIFLHSSGRVFAEAGITFETLYCETISFLEDGTMVTSAICEPIAKFAQFEQHGVFVNCVPEVGMLELIESHFEYLESTSKRMGQSVREISKSNWKEFYQYQNHKFGTARFELGELAEPPDQCEFPQPALQAAAKSATLDAHESQQEFASEDHDGITRQTSGTMKTVASGSREKTSNIDLATRSP